MLQRYKDLQDIIAILGIDELSEEDKLVVGQPCATYPAVPLAADVRGRAVHRSGGRVHADRGDDRLVQGVLDGEMDEYPEQAFYMVGGREDVERKAAELAK